jgi:hypothetical protein
MAAYNKFQDFIEQVFLGKHVFGTHVYKLYLSNAVPSASADAVKADLAEISAGNGYTAGGSDMQLTEAEAAGTLTITGTSILWTASGGTIGPFQYAASYNDTQTSPVDPLVCWWDRGAALTLQDGESFRWKPNNSASTGTVFTAA